MNQIFNNSNSHPRTECDNDSSCCICGHSLAEGYAVLFRAPEGQEFRIDQQCCAEITDLLKSTDMNRVQYAISYMSSMLTYLDPMLRARVTAYIERGRERIEASHNTYNRTDSVHESVDSAGYRASSERINVDIKLELFLDAAKSFLRCIISYLSIAFDHIRSFFIYDKNRITLAGVCLGLRTWIVSGVTAVLLLIVIISSLLGGGEPSLIGKWTLTAINMSDFSMNSMPTGKKQSFEFRKDGTVVSSTDAVDDIPITMDWTVNDDTIVFSVAGLGQDMEYYFSEGKLVLLDPSDSQNKMIFSRSR